MGESYFEMRSWIPRYLRWYLYTFGPRIDDAAPGRDSYDPQLGGPEKSPAPVRR